MKKRVTLLAALVAAASASFGQSQLTVNCYNSSSDINHAGIYTAFLLDGNMIEYATCGFDPAFYVGVIDPATCSAWGTNANGENPGHSFGNFNDNGEGCRQRVERYFVFRTSDSLQLEGMRNMLQQIPSGHSIIVYAPLYYDYTAVQAVNSNLTQELESRWDPAVIQGNSVMVLYGVQGDAASFTEETTLDSEDKVTFTTTIGCDASLSVNEQAVEEKLFVKQNGTSFTLNPELTVSDLQIMNATGKTISFTRTDNTIQLQNGTSAGIYLFQATVSGKMYRTKQLVSF